MSINKYEPIHTTDDWEVRFDMEWYKKLQERQKYDEVWELIKKKFIGHNYGNRFR